MASDEEYSDGEVDSDGEVASGEKEDVVEEGESTDQEVVHQEFSHLKEDFGEYFIHNHHLHLWYTSASSTVLDCIYRLRCFFFRLGCYDGS